MGSRYRYIHTYTKDGRRQFFLRPTLKPEYPKNNGCPKAYARIESAVQNIIYEILDGKVPVYGLAEISTVDSYTYVHSVDVCILSVMTGCHLHYKKPDLMKLAIGSLLHDLGKSRISNVLLNKPEELTTLEISRIKRHPELGYEMLRKQDDISPASCSIVLYHHERHNGSGYPQGLKGEQIQDFVSICAIADVYNAMTTDRVYRRALPPSEVYEMLLGSGNQLFPIRTVSAFLKCVDPYPVSTLVRLSTGDVACVTATESYMPLRPEVVIIGTNERMKLAEELSVTITGYLSAAEAQKLIMQSGKVVAV